MNLAGVTRNPNAVSSAPNPDRLPGDASTPKDAEKGKKKHEPHAIRTKLIRQSPRQTRRYRGASEREGATVRSRAREPKNRPAGSAIEATQGRPQGNQGQAPQGQGQGKPAKGKKDKAEEAPSPAREISAQS